MATAAAQHGIITRSQALGFGVPPSTLGDWLASGRLESVHRSTYQIAGSPRTWEQAVIAAVLAAGPGAAASHRAAATLWSLIDDPVVEITVPRGRMPRLRGALVHRSRDLAEARLSLRRAIPVTSPMRTLVDLGAVCSRSVVDDALESGLADRLFTHRGVEWALDEVARRGRRGAGVLRAILDERALGEDRPDGVLEPRFARLLRNHGLPQAAFQHPIRFAGRRFRIDFAYPDLMLAIEVDGWRKRASPRAMQSDIDRQNAIVLLGWTPIRFTWADVVRRPHKVAADLRLALDARRKLGVEVA